MQGNLLKNGSMQFCLLPQEVTTYGSIDMLLLAIRMISTTDFLHELFFRQ